MMELASLLYNNERQNGLHREAIMKEIIDNTMAPLYEQLCVKHEWQLDEELLKTMKEKNEVELKNIEQKLEEATTNAGDTEVLDAMILKAKTLSRIGSWTDALKAFDAILAKEKTSTGKKIDATMEKAKIALFNMDTTLLKETVGEAKKLNDAGGDWDRRNRLKVYEAFYLLSVRDLKEASKMFLDCVATFTCTELCSYKQFMFYTLLTSLISLDRNELRKKVIDDPHVITAQRELPRQQALLSSIYNCDYSGFFKAILDVEEELLQDRFLGPVVVYLVREYRVLAYAQFLEAYKSVMLSSMAASFGIGTDLLDAELSRFIAAGRLNAKIDKVGDIIETIRPDRKNAQYQDVIKKGDHLLNQIQKLVRAIDV
mmetsp:Transcript_125845/g.246648  ORF Transcript_125845/g.246648 Transcript_125845/m.246648 type:complete len:372 (-) Transcript_125845:76-1191(-)